MPTTILHGETYEDAKKRRFREEAATDARILGQTLCWRCNAAYEAHSTPCPNCQAINGNVDPKGAMRQANGPQGYEP